MCVTARCTPLKKVYTHFYVLPFIYLYVYLYPWHVYSATFLSPRELIVQGTLFGR